MNELKDITDQLESVSFEDSTKELLAAENALVIVGNVQKLKNSEDYIIVSPLNDCKRKFQFKIQDLERIEKIENQVFRVYIKVDSSCIEMTNARTTKSNAGTRRKKRFDFENMKFLSYRSDVSPCYLICDSRCDINCDSCYTDCYCTCICDCNYVA
ncbi:hypothetical protein [Pelotalea chapellei]|uniref:Uncharacterized protein n=1 Tax=Pelotalea chapellei TaxID=44671 RepID=A0ABS5UBE2_9BACT|nr:hypothetical protein [Pelotalea chapellei]MBT1072953.1 hypothetical protein [Pelotalea chapellei]